jgi:hypothetical protein
VDTDELARMLVMLSVAVLDALPGGGSVTIASSAEDREVPRGADVVIRPSAVVRMVASGLGVRPLGGVERAREVVGAMEGAVIATHEPGRSASAEILLPLVLPAGR